MPPGVRVLEREPVDAGAGTRCGLSGAGVVGVEHKEVVGGLRGKDTLFGAGVVLEGAVPVEVVRRDVEDDGDLGMKLLGAFELEAGDFKDRPGFVCALVDERDDGDADVAADQGVESGCFEDFADQRRWWWFCRWSR